MRNIKLPEISEIPHDVFPKKVLQRQWLVDGKLKTWEGQVQEVYSPVQCKSEKKPFYLGSYPCLSGKDSM
jgi:hypothetical protein